MNRIFYSLSAQDLPAFFEDHLSEFMDIMLSYLSYNSDLLGDNNFSEEVLEKLKTSICEIVHLYCLKYEEDFPMLPRFVERILTLLASTPLDPKFDSLISTALSVLTIVAKRPVYGYFFESQDTLKIIVEKIILPNIQLREAEEELIENDPLDYVRRDLEGSELDSRKKAAEDLIRSLVLLHGDKIAPILSSFIIYCLHVIDILKSVLKVIFIGISCGACHQMESERLRNQCFLGYDGYVFYC